MGKLRESIKGVAVQSLQAAQTKAVLSLTQDPTSVNKAVQTAKAEAVLPPSQSSTPVKKAVPF